ncbi:hypothetical protein PACTADRAFT_49487 [Pachysolen tannophilus NRRL Y-2460]|uniref:RRM domain-containing protein n=1 Tax=Pachysolen tannophilus NRRL Y-2460 TaxID=669874 RepID=A0A1E4TWE2_PACTA|nr:hypothetical protein PACTADRAFT_49487 [Pachysolen tannophilus NRRL Y-2460]
MNSIRAIQELNQQELDNNISASASWHQQYKDSSYIYIGSLPFDLTEGDILTIFSQYGVPVDLKLVRDSKTGNSKGFGFLKYEDQRSTILAVDNLNGIKILDRTVKVDHCIYKPFKSDDPKEMERIKENERIIKEELDKDLEKSSDEELQETSNTIKTIKENNDNDNNDDEFKDPMEEYLQNKNKQKNSSDSHNRNHHRHHHRRKHKSTTKEASDKAI